MNRDLRLDGRVAVVTGGGRGLGRAHALLLASRGAGVVVNDLGSDVSGAGASVGPAATVVAEIVRRGGQAAANQADIADPAGARTIIEQALDEFGRIDIVVNNAGIFTESSFAEASLESFQKLWSIHVGGTVNVTQSAWPHLAKQGYGRVVVTGSTAGCLGQPMAPQYSAAKGALHGLAMSLAAEGRGLGISVNQILPAGFTRMVEDMFTDPAARDMAESLLTVDRVSPIVVWLSHDSCQVNGATYVAFAGRFARVRVGEPAGYWRADSKPEDIGENLRLIESTDALRFPSDAGESTGWVFEHSADSLGTRPS